MTEQQHHDPDSLAERLEALFGAGQAPDLPEGDADPRLDAALRLAHAPRPELPAEAMARIQQQVLAAHRQQAATGPRPARYRPAQALRWAAAAVLLVALLVAGLTPAVAASLPGDALYPVKRAVEGIELALASSAQEQAAVRLAHAGRRAEEAQALWQQGRFAPELVSSALEDLAAAAQLARSEGGVPAAALQEMEARTIALVAQLGGYVQQAQRSGQVPEATLAPVQATLQAAQLDGTLLLPPPQPSPTPPPEVPTLPALPAAQTPTATDSPWPTFTPTGTPASRRRRMVSSRRHGAAARGSALRHRPARPMVAA